MCCVSCLADICLVWAIIQLQCQVQVSQVKIFSTLLIHAQLLGSYRAEKRWPLGANLIATNVIFIAELNKLETRRLLVPKASKRFY